MPTAQRLHLVHTEAFTDSRPALTIQIDEKGTMSVDTNEPQAWLAALDDGVHDRATFPIEMAPRVPASKITKTPFRRAAVRPAPEFKGYSPFR
jgi:hypothetical protein